MGSDINEVGDGLGSFQVAGNVWHSTYGNPETGSPITNGSDLERQPWLQQHGYSRLRPKYVFNWVLFMMTLICLKWTESRLNFGGSFQSKAAKRFGAGREECAHEHELRLERDAKDCSNASTGSTAPHANEKTVVEISV